MRSNRILRHGLMIGLVLVTWAYPVAAQAPPGDQAKPPGPFFSLSGSAIAQLDADFDTQGSYSVSSLLFRASVAQPVSRKTILGLSLSYDHLDYDFSDDAALESASPWDRVHGLNLALPVIRKINDRWIIAPESFHWLVWCFWSQFRRLPDLRFGLCRDLRLPSRPQARIRRGLPSNGSAKLGPFHSSVSTGGSPTRTRLTNPLTVGPTGPAGLELAYELSPTWEFGVGGAYRTIRFRLDDQDLEPNGIGEQRGIVTFARILHNLSPKINLVIYTGLVLSGELRIEDENSQQRRTAEHDTAPLLAISLSGRF